jgi:hypothetical protein
LAIHFDIVRSVLFPLSLVFLRKSRLRADVARKRLLMGGYLCDHAVGQSPVTQGREPAETSVSAIDAR